ncbi:MAG TPA: phosphatase PAP2 family protein [Candidatus Angelobacter sp.]|nr:phosphatase PAP2 family protein [Candidatus Angelobacter sp.]
MALEIIETPKKTTGWSTKQCVIVAIISLVLGTAVFILAYIGVHQNSGLGVFNQPILSFIIENRDPNITNIMKIITMLANPLSFAAVVSVIAFIWAICKREIWRPILLASAMGIATVLSILLKILIMNDRPAQTNMILPFELDYSFPSGHTIGITVFLLVLGYLMCSRHSSGSRSFGWVIITIIGVSTVAISRLYLGYHWLTDVVASLGLGLIILAIVIFVDRLAARRFKN